jgi:hypothetical protein
MKLLNKILLTTAAALNINSCRVQESVSRIPPDSEIRGCSAKIRKKILQATQDIRENEKFINWKNAEYLCKIGMYDCGEYADLEKLKRFYKKVVDEITKRKPEDYRCFQGKESQQYPGGFAYGGTSVVLDERCADDDIFLQNLIMHEVAHNVEQKDGVKMDAKKHSKGKDYIYLLGHMTEGAENIKRIKNKRKSDDKFGGSIDLRSLKRRRCVTNENLN